MTISVSDIATNTKVIEIRDELNSAGLISSITDVITSGFGWTLYDTVDETEYNPVITKVYRVINRDGATYKYFIIDYDTIHWEIRTFSCEDWNLTTQKPLNRTWNAGGCFPQPYDLSNSEIVLNGSDAHLVLWPFYLSEPGMWSGVFEFERIHAQSDAPCFAWTNSELLGQDNYYDIEFVFPRTVMGSVGGFAANAYQPLVSRGSVPQSLGSACLKSYQWDTNKILVSSISTDGINYSMPFGNMINTGVTGNIGGQLDTTAIEADVTNGVPKEGGEPLEYLLLPLSGGNLVNSGYSNGQQVLEQASVVNPSAVQIAIGSKLFMATASGVQKLNVWGMTEPFATVFADPGGCYDMVFDGERTIFATTTNGIVAIDVYTEATTEIALPGGGVSIDIDNKNIYVSERTKTTTPRIYYIDRVTLSVVATHTPASYPAATRYRGICSDYQGNIYSCVEHPFNAYNAAYKSVKLDSLCAVVASVAILSTVVASTNTFRHNSFVYDYVNDNLYMISAHTSPNTSAAWTISIANKQTLAFTSTQSINTALSAGTDSYGGSGGVQFIRGVMFGGFLMASTEQLQSNANGGAGCPVVSLSIPTGGMGVVLQISGTASASAIIGTTMLNSRPLLVSCRPHYKGSVLFSNCPAPSNQRISKVSKLYNMSTNRLGQPSGRLLVKA